MASFRPSLEIVWQVLYGKLNCNDRLLDTVDDNLLCGICHDILENPETACREGHVFCGSCLDQCVTTDSKRQLATKCPCCRDKLRRNRVKTLDKLIKNLRVKCSSSECKWQGKIDGLPKHFAECCFQVVQCSFEGCTHSCQRRMLLDHYTCEAEQHARETTRIIQELRTQLVLCNNLASAASPHVARDCAAASPQLDTSHHMEQHRGLTQRVLFPVAVPASATLSSPSSSSLSSPSSPSTTTSTATSIALQHVSDAPHTTVANVEDKASGRESQIVDASLNWVPVTKVQVHVTSGIWAGRRGYVTELLGSECKIDLTTAVGRCTAVVHSSALEAIRPVKNSPVVVVSGELRGKKGVLNGICRGEAIVKMPTPGAEDEIHVFHVAALAMLAS